MSSAVERDVSLPPPSRMEQGFRGGGGKKAKVGAWPAARPMEEVEVEESEGEAAAEESNVSTPVEEVEMEESEGEAAAEESNASRERINLWFPKDKFHCCRCPLPLRPPIFKCGSGRLACSACHDHGHDIHSAVLDEFIRSATTSCVYEEYGCSSSLAYYKVEGHERSCPCAPCGCPEKDCPFKGPPEMLIDHFANEHSQDCSIVALRYGQDVKLTLTAAVRWHALVGLDRSLFLVSRRESGTDTAVSVCCVRANYAGYAAAQYKCRLAVGFPHGGSHDGEVVVMESKVRSNQWPGLWPTPAFMGFLEQLDDTVTLSIRIDLLRASWDPDMNQPLRMERGLHRDGKKGKVGASATTHPAKQVELEEEDGGDMVVANVETGIIFGSWINLWVDKTKFYCYCTQPLRPPIYQCNAGHLTCSRCEDEGCEDECSEDERSECEPSSSLCCCCLDRSYRLDTVLEDFILSAKAPCPYDIYGCRSYVEYYKVDDHKRSCPCAPCGCPEKCCPFMGPPEMLVDHMANAHAQDCSIVALRYGQEVNLTLTAALRWHALVGLEDRSLFLVSRRESGTDTAVSVFCLRANDAGDAASQYKCRLAVGFPQGGSDDGEVVVMESKVRSSRLPGAWPTPAFMGLLEQLDDTVTLSIRIDQVQPADA